MYGSLPMQQIKFMGHLISMLDKLSIIIGEVLLIMCAAALGLPNLNYTHGDWRIFRVTDLKQKNAKIKRAKDGIIWWTGWIKAMIKVIVH